MAEENGRRKWQKKNGRGKWQRKMAEERIGMSELGQGQSGLEVLAARE
jgi:hypothetical protein